MIKQEVATPGSPALEPDTINEEVDSNVVKQEAATPGSPAPEQAFRQEADNVVHKEETDALGSLTTEHIELMQDDRMPVLPVNGLADFGGTTTVIIHSDAFDHHIGNNTINAISLISSDPIASTKQDIVQTQDVVDLISSDPVKEPDGEKKNLQADQHLATTLRGFPRVTTRQARLVHLNAHAYTFKRTHSPSTRSAKFAAFKGNALLDKIKGLAP